MSIKAELVGDILTPKYPYLGVSAAGVIVQFSQSGRGVVVKGSNVGYYSSSFYEEDFKPLVGKLILSNA